MSSHCNWRIVVPINLDLKLSLDFIIIIIVIIIPTTPCTTTIIALIELNTEQTSLRYVSIGASLLALLYHECIRSMTDGLYNQVTLHVRIRCSLTDELNTLDLLLKLQHLYLNDLKPMCFLIIGILSPYGWVPVYSCR